MWQQRQHALLQYIFCLPALGVISPVNPEQELARKADDKTSSRKKKKKNSAPIFFSLFSAIVFSSLFCSSEPATLLAIYKKQITQKQWLTRLWKMRKGNVFSFFFLLSKWLHVSLSLSDKRGSWHLKCVMTKKSCTLAVLWAVTSWTRDDVACMTWWWESSWALWKGTRNYIHCRCTPMTLLLLFSFQLNMNWERKKKINNEKEGRGILPLWK